MVRKGVGPVRGRRTKEMNVAKCEICGAFFVPRAASQVACGEPKCRAEKKSRRRVKREGRKLLHM